MQNSNYAITTFYRFVKFSDSQVEFVQQTLQEEAEKRGIRGLVILGNEGLNGTICGWLKEVNEFKSIVKEVVKDSDMFFKDSSSDHPVFHRFKVKVRDEIVTLGRPDLVPYNENCNHLSPQEWHQMLQQEDVVCIDTRNDYEVEIGKFKQAIDFNIKEFTEFPEKMATSGIEKSKKVMIYCTGGIRCEKAILDLKEQGFENVYQLKGGILNYLKEYPQGEWDGECFVFDHRVAVDQELQPSKNWSLCPHCGDPVSVKSEINCIQCGIPVLVCNSCQDEQEENKSCSKNCAHHFRMGHTTTRVHEDAFRKRHPKSDSRVKD